MKRKKVDSHTEQQIITAMVMSKEFLSQMASTIDVSLFQNGHLKQIAKWCVKYYEKYHKAPKANIESIYHSWVRKGKAQEEQIEAVHDVLEILSDQYDQEPDLNIPYLTDSASEHFTNRRVHILKEELEYALTEGDGKEATNLIHNFSAVTTHLNMGIDVLNDNEAWEAAFSDSQKPLIKWGNSNADYFFGSSLVRDGLIGVLAPEKRGKTFFCVEFAMRALMNRKRVALFEVGDMSESQILKRIGVRLTQRPLSKKDLGKISVPTKIIRDENDAIVVIKKKRKCEKVVSPKSVQKAIKKFMRGHGIKENDPHLMTSVHPNSSVNVQDITAILDQWELHKNFIPDFVIIDYPDILAPEPDTGGSQTRDQVNATWKALRKLSQERHCLVIAPTQADANSYTQELLNATNFSEDKRKLSHVTGMLGLNQTTEEKEQNLMRLNWIVLREGEFSVSKCLYVGQCLALGKAFTCASF